MKDLRDLIGIIEEGQYAFDDSHAYFDGVWDAFKRIETMSVPDAVAPMSPDLIQHQAKRYRAISSNHKHLHARDHDRDEVLDEADETTFAKLSTQATNKNNEDKS